MSFMERARALYQKGDPIRAAFVLAEGVKRDPSCEEGLHWFLQIYVDDLERPGLEQELIRLVEAQPNGDDLLEAVCGELKRRQQFERLSYLDRVRHLRTRAAQARRKLRSGPGSREESPAVAAAASRYRRRRSRPRRPPEPSAGPAATPGAERAVAATEPAEPDTDPDDDRATRRPGRRRRRKRSDAVAAQGVLALDAPEAPAPDRWRNFKGVAGDLDPLATPPSVGPLPTRWKAGGGASRPEPAPPEADDSQDAETVTAGDSVADTQSSAVDQEAAPAGERESGPASRRVRSLRPVRAGRGASLSPAADEPSGLHTPSGLLAIGPDDGWSFGEPVGASGGHERGARVRKESVRSRRTGRRQRSHRARLRRAVELGRGAVRALGRGVRRLTRGKRGLLLIGVVLLLGGAGAGYRACTGFVASQLAKADQLLARADGQSLRFALALYDEHLDMSKPAEAERADFVRALLAADFGDEPPALSYPHEEAVTAFGAAAVTLTHISAGNLAAARPEGEEIVARFESDWLAHWVRGRVAAAEGNWGRAQSAFERARELSPEAVLPVVWLIDLALRNGYDERAEQLLAELAELNPDHPLVPVGRAIVALGLDPLRSRAAGSLEVEMPEAETLSLRTIELVTYIRARQALAAWQMDQVAHVLRQLGEHTGLRPGVRAQLLAALVLARHYRLQETVEALDGALAATQSSSPAALEVRRLAGVILADLGRPDLALARIGEHPSLEVQRARMLVEAGREEEALRLLGRLLDQPATRTEALRILVDFHLRRGPEVADRARLRASGLTEEADLAYAAARLAAEEGDWEAVREHAERALQLRPEDRESRFLWVRASAEMGFAERAIERIDEVAERSILVGAYELARLEVLLIGGAPRENIAEFVSLLQSTEPTSMTSLGILARAYESIGDIERARNAAQAVLEGEPNNRAMHALLGRLLHTTGQLDEAGEHLRTYLALAPPSEPTDWAQTLLDE